MPKTKRTVTWALREVQALAAPLPTSADKASKGRTAAYGFGRELDRLGRERTPAENAKQDKLNSVAQKAVKKLDSGLKAAEAFGTRHLGLLPPVVVESLKALVALGRNVPGEQVNELPEIVRKMQVELSRLKAVIGK